MAENFVHQRLIKAKFTWLQSEASKHLFLVLWFEMSPTGSCLYTQSPAGGTVWEGCRALGGGTSQEELGGWGDDLMLNSLTTLPGHSVLAVCRCNGTSCPSPCLQPGPSLP